MIKEVHCYSKEGNHLKIYESARSLDNIYGLYPDTFRKHVDRPYHLYKGYFWSYTKKDSYHQIYNEDTLLTKEEEPEENPARILILDIETAPINANVFRIWKENISKDQILSDWFMLTWSAKWLYDTEVLSDRLKPQEAQAEDDKRISLYLWDLVDEADIVIAYNGKKFDIPRINTCFLKHGMMPPSHFVQIDPLITYRKEMGITSNRLDYVNNFLGLETKLDTDMILWNDARVGNEDALLKMETYNKQDVIILEENYLKIRPWIKNHPNVSLYNRTIKECCHRCGSEKINWDGGFYVTPMGKYSTYRCLNCGGQGRSRFTALTKEDRRVLTSPIAK